jgi:Fibronectin type-III domain
MFTVGLSFICGVQPGGGCTGVRPVDPNNLNVPSIAIVDMAGSQTVTRKVTNVSGNPGTFTVAFTRITAPLSGYTGGHLRWTNGVQTARVPVVVRTVALAAPLQACGS